MEGQTPNEEKEEETSAAVKPGASSSISWPLRRLTQCGLMVHKDILSKSPVYGN